MAIIGIMNNKKLDGAPGETRTPNLLIRSQTLYPIELRAQSWRHYLKTYKGSRHLF
jgi:hypothetical protein